MAEFREKYVARTFLELHPRLSLIPTLRLSVILS